MVVGKVVAHLCLALIINELKFSVEESRMVTTLNLIKHKYHILCSECSIGDEKLSIF